MEQIFIQLAIILLTAFVLSYVIRAFNQPLIIGYIVAGIIISPFILSFGTSQEVITTFSEFGIAFLLFMIGLHLNPKVIKEIGGVSLIAGLVTITSIFAVGFLVSSFFLGFNYVASAYIGIALAFSSTIIIMKMLSDKGHVDSLYGKIAVGILIVEDLVAIIALMFISSVSQEGSFFYLVSKGILIGGGLIILLFLFGFFIFPKVVRHIAKSQELLFLFSITWAFLIAGLFSYIGFSVEIGALIAGIVLSISPYSTEITSKIKPLRDFFLIIFFIILGFNIQIDNISGILLNALILSFITLALKPLILMALMAMFGYTKRTNFLVGTSLAQISEFSLIVLTLGVAVGHIGSEILSTITLTAMITIAISTYMISYSNVLYKKSSKWASFFERKNVKREEKVDKPCDAILFGYNRIGFSILRAFKKIRKKYLVVDFNPDVVANLQKFRIPVLYGDAFDADLLEDLKLDKVKIVVSTIPDFETNLLLIEEIREVNKHAIIIVRAHQIEDAFELYKKGASYVLTPHFLGGEYVAKMISHSDVEKKDYRDEKEKHMKMLHEIIEKGKRHPDIERG